jgi:hypothetical protein
MLIDFVGRAYGVLNELLTTLLRLRAAGHYTQRSADKSLHKPITPPGINCRVA